MKMEMGQIWRCMNRECNCEISVTKTAELDGRDNPRCTCGSPMKKSYSSPALRVFDAAAGAALYNKETGHRSL